VLGVYDEVPVDMITVIPRPGDRFVLCSDGLFNEVTEEGITSVLRRLVDPAEAADELVRLAVQGGGRDNITVIVVDVLEDGDRAGAASQALAGDDLNDTAAMAPYSGGAYAPETLEEEAGATFRVRRARQRRKQPSDDKRREGGRHSAGGRPRRLTWRVLGFSLLVLALLGGVFLTIEWYARNAYFVGFEGDDVAIFRGRPGGVAWIDPELEERTPLQRDELPEDEVLKLSDGKEESSFSDAQLYVDNLVDRVDDLERGADEATTTTTTTAPTTTRPGGTTPTTGA
jgi:PPM family protein phosphatase